MKRRWIGLTIVVVLAAAVLAVAGCGGAPASSPSPSPSASPASGVEGRVLLSGGPVAANMSPSPHPYPASEVAAYDLSGRLVASARPDRDAAYRIELPPGRYTIKARPTSGNPWFAPREVSVEAGGFVHVDLVAQIP